MIVNAGYRGKVGASALKFTYTGNYNVRKDGVVELLTSGTLVFLNPAVIDVFCVGGGSGGTSTPVSASEAGFGGGAGGYTRTIRDVSAPANTSIIVTIGEGGLGGTPKDSVYGLPGGSTAFGSLTVDGGTNSGGNRSQTYSGRNGGSGGGGGVASNSKYGTGGSNGSNGEQGSSPTVGGMGQGFTTREFGEATGKLYAGGGGGGRYMSSNVPVVSAGGSGGGGSGAWYSATGGIYQAAAAGVANTGGGGGGGAAKASSIYEGNYHTPGASGGSGIVCFRMAQRLPGLAGTWVLNERLYVPESAFSASVNLKATIYDAAGSLCNAVKVVDNKLYVTFTNADGDYQLYDFSTNTWSSRYNNSMAFMVTSTTTSDVFRKWLASNAAKQ